jgi:XRE family transcriptional regulator, regulator of sulfur utilization
VKASPAELVAMESFAANVQRLRRKRGWTQEAFADAVGFSPRYIRRLESGEVDATLRTMARVAAALGVPLASMLKVSRLPEPKPGRPRARRAP